MPPATANDFIARTLGRGPVIPVLVIDHLKHAVPLAQALVDGGVLVLEVTLRTPQALAAIEAMARAVPQACIAAGTVTTAQQLQSAHDAGAHCAVSPGLSPRLLEAATRPGALPLLPGIATASELMNGLDAGFQHFKLFPAQACGGVALLKSLHGPFPDAMFCPTGGITAQTAPDYLRLPNVACVGGSWLAPAQALDNGDWDGIRQHAQAAAALRTAG